MKTFIGHGDTIELTVPDDTDYAAGVDSGEGVISGYLFGIAVTAAAAGETVPCKTTGVYKVTKTGSQAWTEGAKIYFDATGQVFTTTTSGNKHVGHATVAVAGGANDTTGYVRLQGFAA